MSKSLNRVIVEEYLKDLRSGNFKQCRNREHYEDSHCAIGLFELTYKRIMGENIGMESYKQIVKITNIGAAEIYSRNDGGWSFSEIADYIEENSPVMGKVG